MPDTLHFSPDGRSDHTPAIRSALADTGLRRLVFAPGRYDFRPERAAEHYVFPSNNDEGLKRVAFPLLDRADFEIEAPGALFVFHGGIVPFLLQRCARVTLRGFSLDWAVPFHGEAEVLSSDPAGVEIRPLDGFPCRVAHGRVHFGPPELRYELRNVLEFDPVRRETAYLVRDNYGIGARCHARELAPGRIRLEAAFSEPLPTPGNVLALMGERRDFPAIIADASESLLFENLRLHHAGGMGLIAQRSTDLTLRRVHVTPPPDGSRLVSTTADATHFVNCRGHVRLLDCRFEQQMDDPANIHGIYARVAPASEPAQLECRLIHPQQFGVTLAAPGDRVELIDGTSLETWHQARVVAVEVLNKEFTLLTLDPAPPRPPRPGDALGNLTWSADVEIRGCTCRGNRARGFLLSTSGQIRVEENHLHVPGAGVLIEGDANFWFESGAVRDVLIRKNHFDNCNYGVWGRAAIQISPGVAESARRGSRYHRNIRIEENTFTAFDGRIVYAHGVDDLHIARNRIHPSDTYPARHPDAEPFDTGTCSRVLVQDNALPTPA